MAAAPIESILPAPMRTLLVVLLVVDLLLGAWIAWGDPQDGSHEPGRLERQIQPARLRVIGDEELQRARQRSTEAGAEGAGAPAAAGTSAATKGTTPGSGAAAPAGAPAKAQAAATKK
jgi:hypothetical protein